jgi:GT2 family glycosyltransferase
MPKVTIIILNYNGREDTLKCLDSLRRIDYEGCEVTLVDNASADATVDEVRNRFGDVRIIENPRNIGFAAGCNVGIRDALARGADYVLLINNDTEVIDPGFLKKLVDFTLAEPAAGPLSPLILYEGSDIIWFAGGRVSILTGFSRHLCKGKPASGMRTRQPYEADYVSGCAMLLGAGFLREVGLLDEEYFFYYEDTDLCFRGRAAGYRSFVVPSSTFSHRKSATAGVAGENRLTPFQAYYMACNAILFGRKNLSGWHRAAFLAAQFTVRLAYNALNVTGVEAFKRYLAGLKDGVLRSAGSRPGGP